VPFLSVFNLINIKIMYTSFDSLPGNSKVWIYQATRSFTSEEKHLVSSLMQSFVEGWDSHGKALMASFLMPYDQFIVIAVAEDVAMASGCSIDKSVELIRQIEARTGLSLLDRSLVAYKEREAIRIVPVNAIGRAVAEGQIQADTIIFNNAVTTLADFKNSWEVQAGSSWMKRHFKSAHVSGN
jgi:hypothetical protein